MSTDVWPALSASTFFTSRRRRGVALLVAGCLVALLLQALGVAFYFLPLLSGLAYLGAAIAGGRDGALWGPAAVVGTWGITVVFWFRHWVGVHQLSFDGWSEIGLGLGILVALSLRRVGIHLGLLSAGAPLLLVGLFVVGVDRYGGVFAEGGWYGAAFVCWGLWELRPQRDRPGAGPGLQP